MFLLGRLFDLFYPSSLRSSLFFLGTLISNISSFSQLSKLNCLSSMTLSIGTIFNSFTTTVFLILSLLAIRLILLRNFISIALTLFLFLSLNVHDSLPYISDGLTTFWRTSVLISLTISLFPKKVDLNTRKSLPTSPVLSDISSFTLPLYSVSVPRYL